MGVGERLKAVRKQIDATQEEFARKLGVKMMAVSRYETGTRVPSIETIANLRENVHVDINWLLTGEGSMFGDGEEETTSDSPFILGDTVTLPNSKIEMTVTEIMDDKTKCMWHTSSGELQQSEFPTVALKKVEE
jgi:transcriptional regulator with XRE-family HTH domain